MSGLSLLLGVGFTRELMEKMKTHILKTLNSRTFYLFYFLILFIEPHIESLVTHLCYYGIASNSSCSVLRIPDYEGYYSFGSLQIFLFIFLFCLFVFFGAFISKQSEETISWKTRRRIFLILLLPLFGNLLSTSIMSWTFPVIEKVVLDDVEINCCNGTIEFSNKLNFTIHKDQVFCAIRKPEIVKHNQCIFPAVVEKK